MQATFKESDIQSLLTKVKIFNHQIGSYERFTINDAFQYVVKLSNGTIFFTLEELDANATETLNLEMLTSITRRFTPTVTAENAQHPVKESPVASKMNTGTAHSIAKESSGKGIVLVIALILVGLAIGALVFFLLVSNSADRYSDPEIYQQRFQTEDGESYFKPKTTIQKRLQNNSNY